MLGTPIDAQVANSVVAQLLLLDGQNPEREIQLYLNCPGGDVYACLAIYDTMQYVNAPVSTICAGIAMRAGSVVLMAGEHGRRFATPNNRIMIHQGNTPDLEVQAREVLYLRDRMVDLYQHHTGVSTERLLEDMQRDHYLTPEQAQTYGLIEAVIVRPADATTEMLSSGSVAAAR